jgi:TATA-binding protein-associated factor Taf7
MLKQTVYLGEMEADYEGDFWADHDEDCHGPIDTARNREQYPDGFVWTCCEKLGSESGCQLGRHQSNPEKSKKGKYESESEDVETSDIDDDEEDEEDEWDEEDEEDKEDRED